MTPRPGSARAIRTGLLCCTVVALLGCSGGPPESAGDRPSGSPAPGGGSSASSGSPLPSSWAGVDSIIRRRLSRDHLAGAVLVVRNGDSDVVRRTYGSYRSTTVLPLASASKWLTAATVMTLVDEGRIALDAPISAYAPSFQGPAGRVSMRQLLAHTHGLDEAPACVLDPAEPVAACDEEVSKMRATAEPGSRFRYGPTGPTLAARVVEMVGGQPFEQAFQTRIAGPLAMTHTSFLGVVPGQSGSAARTVADPAAGVVSNTDDYLRFVQMLDSDGTYQGRQVLTPGAVAGMLTLSTNHARFKDDQVAADLPSVGYGLGAWVEDVGPGEAAVFIDGSGAYGAYPWIDRRRRVYGMLLVYDTADPGATGAVARSHANVVAVGHVLDQVVHL